jgi:hypothetical protein
VNTSASGSAPDEELAADSLDHDGGERDLADAGVTLGVGLEAAAEPAGLVAHVDHLEHGWCSLEVDPPPAQPGELTEPQPGAKQNEHMIPPEQRA